MRSIELTPEERTLSIDVLDAEYRLLMSALAAAWSASLVRTTIFLGVLSAAGVALGLAAQGSVGPGQFTAIALVVLPVVLFLGGATFVRLIQVQRESIVYITGMNRIRHFFAEVAPPASAYFVLPVHDDQHALYRSPGTGMNRRAPSFPLLYLLVQTQGIVGVVTAAVAAALVGLGTAQVQPILAWPAGAVGFLITAALLFVYWRRSLSELQASIRPRFPTPPDEIGAPF